MNWDRMEGNWKQMTGKVKQQWGKLTDDTLTQINGQRDELVGKIQEAYGISRDEADRRFARPGIVTHELRGQGSRRRLRQPASVDRNFAAGIAHLRAQVMAVQRHQLLIRGVAQREGHHWDELVLPVDDAEVVPARVHPSAGHIHVPLRRQPNGFDHCMHADPPDRNVHGQADH